MLKKQLLVLAVVSVSMLSIAQAEEFQDDRWYIAPFGTFLKTGGDRGAKDGWGGGMGIGKILNEHFNVELKGFYQGFGGYSNDSNGNSGRWDLTGGSADLQYYFARDTFSPYTVVGLGAMNTSVPGDSGIGFIGEMGAGFAYELHDNFLLRSDVRYRYNHNFNAAFRPGTDEYHDMTVNVGFVIPFGAKPKSEPKLEIPVAAAPAEDCSTLDADSDGVNNCLDKCPGTIAGSKVDEQGCPISLELKGVNFKVDSAKLTPSAKVTLDRVAESLMAYPQKNDIEVHGHTSSEGSTKHNQGLSQRRSQSVVDYLVKKGVSNRLYARGFGEEQPIADNSTETGRYMNRRVELIWTEVK
jgi:OmpA-OmpF porin, OOP family